MGNIPRMRNGSSEGISRQNSNSSTTSSSSSSSSSLSCSGGGGWIKDCQLVMMGAGNVGKSALLTQYLSGVFSSHYNPTVEDSYRHRIKLPDGTFYGIHIVDTAGYYQFPAMRDLSIRNGNSFVVVFAIDDRDSYLRAGELLRQIREVRGFGKIPVVLVGNKRDLDENRQISREQASLLANQYQCPYVETSARDNVNIQNMFVEVVSRNFSDAEQSAELKSKRKCISRRIGHKLNIFRRRNNAIRT